MTAINVLRESDCVHVVIDGRALAPGETRRIYSADFSEATVVPAKASPTSKVLMFPHLSLVFAVRGMAWHLPHIAAVVPMLGDCFDSIHAAVSGDLFRKWWEGATAQWGAAGADRRTTSIDIVVAGISETSGPSAYLVTTHSFYHDITPWTPIELPARYFSPNGPDTFDHFAAEPADVDEFAVATLEHQRGLELRSPNGAKILGSREIGMFAQVTTVAKDSVVSRIVHRWPEEGRVQAMASAVA